MPLNYSFTSANINSSAYRLEQRPAPATTAAKIERLRRWLADRPEQAWRASYQQVEQELAALVNDAAKGGD